MPRVINMAPPGGEIAVRKPVCVDRDTTILGASKLMRNYQVGAVVVMDRPTGSLIPVGIISARDIVTRVIATGLDPAVLTAGDISWSEAAGAKDPEGITETLRLLETTTSNVLLVVDNDGSVTGRVSVEELLRMLVKDRSQ